MKKVILAICVYFLKFIYFFIKLFTKVKTNKITFISRQTNGEEKNYLLIVEELKKRNFSYDIVILNKKLESNIGKRIFYIFHMFQQMYHIATSNLVILDSYCICISVLKHKNDLKVIQIWHALGSFKKFGYSVLNKNEGSELGVAQALKMHNNYDYILSSSEFAKKNFMDAFNSEKVINLPLPIVDLLTDNNYKNDINKKIKNTYNKLFDKKIILYIPTFKKNYSANEILRIIDKVDFNKYNFIYKKHPLLKEDLASDMIVQDKIFSSLDWMFVADYIITDYSAISIEAGLLDKKVCFYIPDVEMYNANRGLYINYKEDLKNIYYNSIDIMIKDINEDKYDLEAMRNFTKKMVEIPEKRCVEILVDLIYLNLSIEKEK